MIVAKFGGSSVANVAQIQKVAAIVKSDPKRKFIVVSAPGKRDDQDVKITDLLLDLGDALERKEDYDQQVHAIMERFSEIITGLDIPPKIEQEIRSSIDAILIKDLPIDRKTVVKSYEMSQP